MEILFILFLAVLVIGGAFSLGIWTSNGQNYIRNSILGEKMTFTELDAFLTKLAEEHPEYIDPEYTNKNLWLKSKTQTTRRVSVMFII